MPWKARLPNEQESAPSVHGLFCSRYVLFQYNYLKLLYFYNFRQAFLVDDARFLSWAFNKFCVMTMTPQGAARYNYDKAVADYQNCLAANPGNASACEGQRSIMQADAQVLSSSVTPAPTTNVYVPPR